MIKDTIIIMGPSCIGKGLLDYIFKQDIIRIDPYRLRTKAKPRDLRDMFYVHPKLRDELRSVCQVLNLSFESLTPTVEWFPQTRLLFFKVRKEWQLLFLESISADFGKLEIYAPVIPVILSHPQIRNVFGKIESIVLHPGTKKLSEMTDWSELECETERNCKIRGDEPKSVKDRVNFIKEEAPAWKMMIEQGATEYENWQFAGKFNPIDLSGDKLIKHQVSMLIDTKSELLAKNQRLKVFFKTNDEIKKNMRSVIE